MAAEDEVQLKKEKKEKKEKKDKKRKSSEMEVDEAATPAKKEKKEKKARKSVDASAVEGAADEEDGKVTMEAPSALVKGEAGEEGEGKVKVAVPISALVPFANPLCDEKNQKKVLKGVKKGKFLPFDVFSLFLPFAPPIPQRYCIRNPPNPPFDTAMPPEPTRRKHQSPSNRQKRRKANIPHQPPKTKPSNAA